MKEENGFLDVLSRVNRRVIKLKQLGDGAKYLYKKGAHEAAREYSFQIAENAEKLALLARQLPAFTGDAKAKEKIETIIQESVELEIGFTKEGYFSLKMPYLLPRKEKGSCDYLKGILYPSLRAFFATQAPVRYEKCVIVYRHVYDKKRPERARRDHDNFEVNFVTDAVALYVMVDDSPTHCKHFYYSDEGETERTEVYVIPENEFVSWLATALRTT